MVSTTLLTWSTLVTTSVYMVIPLSLLPELKPKQEHWNLFIRKISLLQTSTTKYWTELVLAKLSFNIQLSWNSAQPAVCKPNFWEHSRSPKFIKKKHAPIISFTTRISGLAVTECVLYTNVCIHLSGWPTDHSCGIVPHIIHGIWQYPRQFP